MNDTTQNLPAVQSESAGVLDIIRAVATNPNVDVLKLERLLDMKERMEAKAAEIAFNEALVRISGKLPRIKKTGEVGYKDKTTGADKKAFKFAKYENIDEAIRPVLIEEGFTLSFDTEQRNGDGGGLIVRGTLSHVKGHNKTASIALALDSSGGKNNIQAMGSSTSYGRRYVTCMLLNIITEDEDDDGNSADIIPLEYAVEIDQLIKEVNADKLKFLKYMGVGDVREIKQKDYLKAVTSLKSKAKHK